MTRVELPMNAFLLGVKSAFDKFGITKAWSIDIPRSRPVTDIFMVNKNITEEEANELMDALSDADNDSAVTPLYPNTKEDNLHLFYNDGKFYTEVKDAD